MSGYCAFFALAMKDRFPELSFALEYHSNADDPEDPSGEGRPEHVLVHLEDRFYDARGYLVGYQPLDELDAYTLTDLEESDVRASGLFEMKEGVRVLPEDVVLRYADQWIKRANFFASSGNTSLPTLNIKIKERRNSTHLNAPVVNIN